MGKGRLLAVVGPSGAGKDSIINAARSALCGQDGILFVRRTISRRPDGVTEEHDAVSQVEFEAAEAAGAFCVTWRAHGLCYGIPQSVRAHVEAGGIAVANGSRAAIDRFAEVFGDALVIVEITARPEIIAARLAARGRETAAEIGQRLARSVGAWSAPHDPVVIDNSGTLEDALSEFLALLATH